MNESRSLLGIWILIVEAVSADIAERLLAICAKVIELKSIQLKNLGASDQVDPKKTNPVPWKENVKIKREYL